MSDDDPFSVRGASLVRLGEGVTVSAIARRVGLDRKTVPRYIARGLEPPAYGPRKPRTTQLQLFERYLRERLLRFRS